jgi:hypothetical protein
MDAPPSKGPFVYSPAPVSDAILRNRIAEPYVPDVYNLSRRLQRFYRGSQDGGAHRKTDGRRRGAYHERDSTMTKIDCLIEVAKKLREARALAERSSDRALLYFIDMTIAHVCDSLDARSETKEASEDRLSLTRAA